MSTHTLSVSPAPTEHCAPATPGFSSGHHHAPIEHKTYIILWKQELMYSVACHYATVVQYRNRMRLVHMYVVPRLQAFPGYKCV